MTHATLAKLRALVEEFRSDAKEGRFAHAYEALLEAANRLQLVLNDIPKRAILDADGEGDAMPLAAWHEDRGDVLWWRFPIEEPPYVGSPISSDWPGYHTHWTPLPPPPGTPR